MKRQGFVLASTLRWEGGLVEGWSRTEPVDVQDSVVDSPAGCACVVGPIWYRRSFAAAALKKMLADLNGGFPIDERELRGNFALFVRSRENTFLINDPLGLVKIYASADGRFRSTSWLAVRAYSKTSDIDEVAAIEYVLLGASHSHRSPATGISRLDLGRGVDLGGPRIFKRFEKGVATGGVRYGTFNDAIEAFATHIRDVSGEISQAFPDRVTCALSGGFDSRLIVAGLMASDTRPHLFVYGDPSSTDVRIASHIASSQGLALDVIDKDALERSRHEPEITDVVANSLFFDGLPNDGILDCGVDRETRLRQCANGAIAHNGGGGEILRNFFHLSEGRYTAIDVIRAFYRGFETSVFRRIRGLRDYQDSLAVSIDNAISAAGLRSPPRAGYYSREQIELVYPLFRCHNWMGVNNAVAIRYGYFTTPLVDLTLVRDSCLLPLAWKNAGRFEASLIAALHSGLASGPSAYGFAFNKGPGLRAHLSEWATLRRPTFARPWISAAGRKLRGGRVPRRLVERWRSILPGEWRLDDTLDLERLPDRSSFSRALAVEVVARELGP
jgi:asparagine synthase (glutamine-hydrolysing)